MLIFLKPCRKDIIKFFNEKNGKFLNTCDTCMEHEEEECPHPPSSSVEDGCPHGVVKTGLTRCDRYPLTQVLSRPLTSTMSVFRVTIKFDIIIIAITCLVDRKKTQITY